MSVIVIGLRSERPLDAADTRSLLGPPPGLPVPSRSGAAGARVRVGAAVWVKHTARRRPGWVVGGEVLVEGATTRNGKRVLAVEVEYAADRSGRLAVHLFPVSELRIRDTR